MVSSAKDNNDGNLNKKIINEKNKLYELRKFIENNFEYVGKDFSKKVREIYYDKI